MFDDLAKKTDKVEDIFSGTEATAKPDFVAAESRPESDSAGKTVGLFYLKPNYVRLLAESSAERFCRGGTQKTEIIN